MNFRPSPGPRPDPLEVADRIDQLCDEFERQFRHDPTTRIEDFLVRDPLCDQGRVLAELLAIEWDYVRNAGEEIDVETYAARFPDRADVVRQVADRFATGTHPSVRPTNVDVTVASASVLLAAGRASALASIPVRELAPLLESRSYQSGDLVMREGEPGDSLLILSKGRVEISTTDLDGRRHVIGTAAAGDVIGEMSMLTSEPRSASVVAVEPVEAKSLSAAAFHDLARRFPEFSYALTRLIADRLGMPDRDALTDKTLDQFAIRRRLGRGGMGIVYEARQRQTGQRVALKMMSHRWVYDEGALRRFQQEADIIESFEHSNIVRMYGRFAAFHTYFIVMEYCQGETLESLLDATGPLDASRFQQITGQLAAALDHAHRAGVVHRDIKPANVMLTPDGVVKLMDFGLAEPVYESDALDGRISGTPRYMAPEQRIGQTAGVEADWFAFGCVAFEMLTGTPLFDGGVRDELRRDFRGWSPPRLCTCKREIARETEAWIRAALHPELERRRLDLGAIARQSPAG